MIGLALVRDGVAKYVWLLQKQNAPDGVVYHQVQTFYFGLIQDSRKETKSDYNPDGLFVIRLVRFTQKNFPVLETLVKIEEDRLFEIYTAGLPWRILQDLKIIQEKIRVVPLGDVRRWEAMWRLFKEEELSEEERTLASMRLESYLSDGLIEEEDYTYYKGLLEKNFKEKKEVNQ